MEGNECYKFSTIQNYVDLTDAKPIRVAVDIGCNLGVVTKIMRSVFWHAQVFGFEVVPKYYLAAWSAHREDPMVRIFHAAVSGEHIFEDDCGERRRTIERPLKVFEALPSAGMGWLGGSYVLPEGELPNEKKYQFAASGVPTVTLDDLVTAVCTLTGAEEIDYIKFDCEYCENSALGCANVETLRKIRFFSGEYHDIERFYRVMQKKLYSTHYVNLIGGKWGGFFGERKGEASTILEPSRTGMLKVRPQLGDFPIDWHLFRSEYVLPHERSFHGLA